MRLPRVSESRLRAGGPAPVEPRVVRGGLQAAEAAGCSASTFAQMLFLTLCVRSTQHGAPRVRAPYEDLTPGQMGGGGFRRELRAASKETLASLPGSTTMHRGHWTLKRRAQEENDRVGANRQERARASTLAFLS